MKTLKSLLENVRAFNLDTDEELDLDSLADIDLDSLLGGDYIDSDSGSDEMSIDFSNLDDLGGIDLNDDTFSFGDEELNVDELGSESIADADSGAGGGGEDFDFDVGSIDLNDEEADLDFDDMSQNQADDIADEDPNAAEGDGDFQGEIRTVRGANLVFKRKMEDGNFEELWIYNIGNDIKRETQVRRAILAGTDVDPGSQESKDGSQRAETSTTGNVQFLHIVGLPQ